MFLFDDHEVVRRGIRELLEGEPDIEVVGESGWPRRPPTDTRAASGRGDPRWPAAGWLGHRVCREVRSGIRIHALILTSYDDDEALFAAIMAGAAGYVLKQVRARTSSTWSGG